MKYSIGMSVALAIVIAAPALAGDGDFGKMRHDRAYRHARHAAPLEAVAPSASAQVPPAGPAPIAFPGIAPYPNGQGDEDGLSRHIGDCNKGCIGGNPG